MEIPQENLFSNIYNINTYSLYDFSGVQIIMKEKYIINIPKDNTDLKKNILHLGSENAFLMNF